MGAGPGPVSGRAWRSAALALGVGLGFSRLLGLARDMFFAGLLGGGLAADIFLAAFRLPHFARRLLHEGAPALAFIPAFVREEAHGGRESALAFGRAAWLELVLAALLLSLAGAAAAGALARMLLPGLSGEAALLEMTAGFIRLGLFYLPLAAGAATGSALLMALGHYAAPACAPLVLNLGLLAAGGLALLAGHSGSAAAETLCLGLILGGLLQNAVQFMAARGLRVRLAGRVSLTAPANLGFLRAMPPAICGAAAHQLHMLAVTVAASFLHQGGISALYYAERLLELPVAL
ncbi:MAG: murein biosynthesis integral membrane protein MurJ, partial [Deltaproteobacteria bacterium]|nr:murein biosynthesis integral membrane protein MurJ [Deltaproteobacteria bacterium]